MCKFNFLNNERHLMKDGRHQVYRILGVLLIVYCRLQVALLITSIKISDFIPHWLMRRKYRPIVLNPGNQSRTRGRPCSGHVYERTECFPHCSLFWALCHTRAWQTVLPPPPASCLWFRVKIAPIR